jgi:dehydrogenase/reductase SDR family member 12
VNPARAVLAQSVDLALEATVVLSFSKVGYQVRRRLFAWPDWPDWPGRPDVADPSTAALAGRVVLVTGATSGLGRAVARRLAGLGATVVVTGRDGERTRRARAELVAETENPNIHDVAADLGHLDQVVALAERVADQHPRLDALVHNAGALVHDHRRTPDGLELTVQTHVVAPFLLTGRLLDRLGDTPGSRVVTVTSGGLYTRGLGDLDADFDPDPDRFDGVVAYARAKRAQAVLTQEWARRTRRSQGAGSGIAFHAVHPGWVDTPGLATALPGFHHRTARWLRTPDQGGDTIAWLTVSPEAGPAPGGHLWLDRHHRWVDKVPWTVTSAPEADRLWHWVADRADLGSLGSVFSAKSTGSEQPERTA